MSSIQIAHPTHQEQLSIAVISPDRQRRLSAINCFAQNANVRIREFPEYPDSLLEVPHFLDGRFDAILIGLDDNPQFAFELVETLCVARTTVVMVFSSMATPELMLRSMRAGAREFFSLPFDQRAVEKAMLWVTSHRRPASAPSRADGRLLVFFGSKGGAGVTTIASNFALALAEQSKGTTLLIDLNLHLGDAALGLGLKSTYSVADALQNYTTLDAFLLSRFLVHHPSGLSLLAAPADLPNLKAPPVAIGCLLAIARQHFDYVVVDAGKKIDLKQMHLFEESATAYLVTQVGIPELRNANRLIGQFAAEHSPRLEIIINRYQSRFLGITDQHLAKALTRAVDWKIPTDYPAVRRMQSNGTPVIHQNSPIAPMIRKMAAIVSSSNPKFLEAS